jgi:hypothetical protein
VTDIGENLATADLVPAPERSEWAGAVARALLAGEVAVGCAVAEAARAVTSMAKIDAAAIRTGK